MVHKFVYGKKSARMVKKRAGAKRGIGTLFEIAFGCGSLRPSCGKLCSGCAKIALVRFCNIRPIVPKSARFRKSARCNKKCIKTCVEHKFVHEWVLQDYIYIYIYISMCIYIYIYIYVGGEDSRISGLGFRGLGCASAASAYRFGVVFRFEGVGS